MGFTNNIIGTNESVGGINLFESVKSTQLATNATAGLMSATDKSKLDGLENYVHPNSGVRPGKYMQVEVNEQGHVTAGRSLQEGTLEDYGIIDAYIDLSDNSIVLGSHRLKPITPSDKVRWDQIINNPDTLAAYGIKDAEISETGIIRLGEMTIKPLTAESTLNTAKLEGIIDKANLPDTLQELGLIDVAITDGTINIGGDLITPLTADSQLAADKITGVIDLKNIPVGAMERCVVVEDDTARFALTTNDVQKGDTVKVINPTPTMYMVVDESKLDSDDGYVVYSAGNANSVPWSGITDKPDHYYTLPPADINTLGGVMVGDNISVDTDGKISTHPPYVLPQASDTVLGGVKVGDNLSMQSDGTVSVPNATATTAGVVKAGNNISIGADGTISGIAYNLPVATNSELGGVKIGDNVETLGDGTLSVPVATADKAGVVKAGNNINISDDGTISTDTYQLPTATALRLGGVKIGKYLSVDSEGLLNATGVPAVASKTDLGGVIVGDNINVTTDGVISVTLPTKLSELDNDTNYITSANLSAHNADDNAHENRFNAHNTDNNAHENRFNAKADNLVNGHGVVRSVNNEYADENGNVNVNGFSIGDIKWSSADLTQVGFLIANGAEVGRATYPDLCAVYEAMGFPWGAGDGSTTFNLPNLIGRFAEGADSAGGYKEAGLPNITGEMCTTRGVFYDSYFKGALTYDSSFTASDWGSVGTSGRERKVILDASRSNATYGNSDTVQPPSALLIPYVKAFNGASADSTDLAISEVANDVARLSANLVGKNECKSYVVESVVNDDGSWYRKYSDGWLEQGGLYGGTGMNGTNKPISFLKPFANTSYTLQVNHYTTRAYSGSADTVSYNNMLDLACITNVHSTTGFNLAYVVGVDCKFKWFACGMGAE